MNLVSSFITNYIMKSYTYYLLSCDFFINYKLILLWNNRRNNNIEGFLKNLIFRILYGKDEYVKDIVIADLASKDETREIAKKLSEDYPFLHVIDWKDCKKIMDSVEEE